MGPWKAAQLFLEEIDFLDLNQLEVHLYGSLAKTGKGHGTDIAVQLGLMGYDPKTIPVEEIDTAIEDIKVNQALFVGERIRIPFNPNEHIVFHFDKTLEAHPNALTLKAIHQSGKLVEQTYYSVGGGFITTDDTQESETRVDIKFPVQWGEELLKWCEQEDVSIHELLWINEQAWRPKEEIYLKLDEIWETMKQCVFRGCNRKGILPGGLNVKRRAFEMNSQLSEGKVFDHVDDWVDYIKSRQVGFSETLKWVSCFALAVNEENASFGRVVTAPTNGASGVIPAVLMYYALFSEEASQEGIRNFIMTAGEVGSIFKKGSTISAAMGGCQAEIGVSSAMAAAGLTECLGGNPQQALMAAEIAMEHHLGMTCDPIGGLVQIPCIERNTMGAIKAITACQIALNSDPKSALVSLDDVIKSMWETAVDMNTKYKETSEGGLASQISVIVPEC